MSERWRWIPGLEGRYEVSDQGRLRSHVRHGPRVMSPFLTRRGYWVSTIPGRRTAVGRLVLEAFVGPAPSPGHEASHLNGMSQDNRLENLVWHTSAENKAMMRVHGTNLMGEQMPTAKLTASQVGEIKAVLRINPFASALALARQYGVSRATIRSIASGKTWAHVG